MPDPSLMRGSALLPPPRRQTTAVAPAGAAAADVTLDEDDVERRLELLQPERGPQARVAAADDADVGALVARQRRRVLLTGLGERLVQPQAPHAPSLIAPIRTTR